MNEYIIIILHGCNKEPTLMFGMLPWVKDMDWVYDYEQHGDECIAYHMEHARSYCFSTRSNHIAFRFTLKNGNLNGEMTGYNLKGDVI